MFTAGCDTALERTIEAKFTVPVKNPTKPDRMFLFLRTTSTQVKRCNEGADIVLAVNISLTP